MGYETGFTIQSMGGTVTEYGNALIRIPFDDLDGNGVWDFAQKETRVSGNFEVLLEPRWPMGRGLEGAISLSRSQGSSVGRYSFTGNHSINTPPIFSFSTITHEGEWAVSSVLGAVSFDPVNLKIVFRGELFGELGDAVPFSASGSYKSESGNIVLGDLTVQTSKGISTAPPCILFRVPGAMSFRGILSIADGNLSTSWPDYNQWTLEVIDLGDANGNGVPDIIDGIKMPPAIEIQPQPLTILTGSSAAFSVIAGGAPPLIYQWQRDGVDISGETGSTLVLTNVQSADVGEYRVVVSNSVGKVASSRAGLSVRPVLIMPVKDFYSATAKISVQVAKGETARIWVATNTLGPWIGWTNVASNVDGSVQLEIPKENSIYRFYRAVVRERTKPSEFVWVSPGACLTESYTGALPVYFRVRPLSVVNGYWICSNEVTQQEYAAVMGTNPSLYKGMDQPVEMVSWNDAVEYCRKLTETERAAGRINAKQTYRLPTANEWEYAARAGHGEARAESSEIVWLSGLAINPKPNPIRTATPNALGLHDMLGNVGEWCSDLSWRGSGPCVDECFYYSQRGGGAREIKSSFLGFRVVLSDAP